MAESIVLPKLGNTVESAIILEWLVAVGERVAPGDALCEVETDKASMEIESSAGGVLLAQLAQAGDDVPVLSPIAVVGQAGESISAFTDKDSRSLLRHEAPTAVEKDHPDENATISSSAKRRPEAPETRLARPDIAISPRALNLARRKGVDYAALTGSGPGGRIIERDIEAALREQVKLTPVARAMLSSGDYELPSVDAMPARVTKDNLVPARAATGVTEIPLKGIRKTIAKRMLASLRDSAQLTLNAWAEARALQDLRRRLKTSDERLGLNDVNINDLLLFALARTLNDFPALNALFENDIVYQHEAAHLALAVDTERGLLVPVIRHADSMSLRQLAAEAKRLAEACRAGKVQPDELSGGTFTVSNLGALGIEHFTPVLNPPQVAILGVGGISPKPIQAGPDVEFAPHIALSLTINHQVVDGAPAARFLQALAANIRDIDLLAMGI